MKNYSKNTFVQQFVSRDSDGRRDPLCLRVLYKILFCLNQFVLLFTSMNVDLATNYNPHLTWFEDV